MIFRIFVQAAGLLEKAAGDLMRLKLGQVPPGETVLVRLDMTMELQNQSGSLAKIVQLWAAGIQWIPVVLKTVTSCGKSTCLKGFKR